MKIAVVAFGIEGRGGKENVIKRVIGGLNQSGVEATLFYLGGSTVDSTWMASLPSFEFGSPSDNKLLRYMKYGLSFPRSLLQFNPDIIVAADENAVFICKWMTRLFLRRIPVGSWIHNALTDSRRTRWINQADFHFALNKGQSLQIKGIETNTPKRVHVIYNPVETMVTPIPQAQIPTFLYVGRLLYHDTKRVSDFLTALSGLKGAWKAIIVGDGPDRLKLQGLANELGIQSNLEWLGWKDDPWAHIKEASALVLTSESEGFGLVLVEAMSRGIACISSSCPVGPLEIIQEGINGWLYPPFDIQRLTSAMQYVQDHPEEMPSPQAIQQSVAHFESGAIISRMIQLCQKEIQERKTPSKEKSVFKAAE
jgi:UDP-D-galactose:(glucosyl)LPS alpha-1,6-D-galactosyltransferase